MTDEEFFHQLQATFWAHFGAGARMRFSRDCVEAAKRPKTDGSGAADGLGYYDNVRSRLPNFKASESFLADALVCCERAGRLAAANAIKAEADEISEEHFKKACRRVEKIVQRASRRNAELVGTMNLAGVCG